VDDRNRAIVDEAGRLPEVEPPRDEPIWRAAIREALARGATGAELIGWAGERHAGSRRSALLLRAAFPVDAPLAPGNRLSPVDELLEGHDAALVCTALGDQERLDTW
jgi:hypothetical protein